MGHAKLRGRALIHHMNCPETVDAGLGLPSDTTVAPWKSNSENKVLKSWCTAAPQCSPAGPDSGGWKCSSQGGPSVRRRDMKINSSQGEVSNGLAQFISSLHEENAPNTAAVFPPCLAHPEPLLLPPGSASEQFVKNNPQTTQAESLCQGQRLIQGQGTFFGEGYPAAKARRLEADL